MPRSADLRAHLRQLKAWSHETFPELEKTTGLTRSQIHGYFYGSRRPRAKELSALLGAMRVPDEDRRQAFILAWPEVARELGVTPSAENSNTPA